MRRDVQLEASLADGAAGHAFALFCSANISGDSSALQVAAGCVERAVEAFQNYRHARGSLLYGAAGVHFVAALVRFASGKQPASEESVREFLLAAQDAGDSLDATFGLASTLIGGTVLRRVLQSEAVTIHELDDFLAANTERLIGLLKKGGLKSLNLPVSGLAHGAAGVVYALIGAAHALGMQMHGALESALAQLAEVPMDADVQPWARKSLCNGAAGMAKLWVAAWRYSRNEQHLERARRSAFEAGQVHEHTGPSLCCGLSGRSLSLLNLYHTTKEPVWLKRASELRDAAARLLDRLASSRLDAPHGLLKGELGFKLTSELVDAATRQHQSL
jgi:hypothetical protein